MFAVCMPSTLRPLVAPSLRSGCYSLGPSGLLKCVETLGLVSNYVHKHRPHGSYILLEPCLHLCQAMAGGVFHNIIIIVIIICTATQCWGGGGLYKATTRNIENKFTSPWWRGHAYGEHAENHEKWLHRITRGFSSILRVEPTS